MKTEAILPATGAFALGVGVGILAFVILLLPHYQHSVNHAHWADEVINECIEQYDDFDDTIAEGDAYCEYILYK